MGGVMADQTERRDDQETREMIDRVARHAVQTTMQAFGFKTDDPTEIQMDMAFVRQSRQRCDKFYGTMWDNLTALFWRGAKVMALLALLGALAAFGLNLDGFRAMLVGILS